MEIARNEVPPSSETKAGDGAENSPWLHVRIVWPSRDTATKLSPPSEDGTSTGKENAKTGAGLNGGGSDAGAGAAKQPLIPSATVAKKPKGLER